MLGDTTVAVGFVLRDRDTPAVPESGWNPLARSKTKFVDEESLPPTDFGLDALIASKDADGVIFGVFTLDTIGALSLFRGPKIDISL